MYVYVCPCFHVVFISMCMYVHICIYLYAYVSVYMCVYVYVYMYIYIYIYIYIYYVCVCVCMCVCVCVLVCVCVCVCMCGCSEKYICLKPYFWTICSGLALSCVVYPQSLPPTPACHDKCGETNATAVRCFVPVIIAKGSWGLGYVTCKLPLTNLDRHLMTPAATLEPAMVVKMHAGIQRALHVSPYPHLSRTCQHHHELNHVLKSPFCLHPGTL